MTDQTEQQQPAEEEEAPTPTTMATDAATSQLQDQTSKLEKLNISFSIWPPTQRTRDAVIARLIETLSAESVLSKRYGTIPQEEASEIARRIEDEAFAAASGAVKGDDDGIEVLQGYSKEISKRMLAAVKSRSGSASSAENESSAPSASEDISSSAENES